MDLPEILPLKIIAIYEDKQKQPKNIVNKYGFNKQPSVQTLKQFSYVWNNQDSKDRVLQRLADQELVNGRSKYTKREWNNIIIDIFKKGGGDFEIYDKLRQLYTASN